MAGSPEEVSERVEVGGVGEEFVRAQGRRAELVRDPSDTWGAMRLGSQERGGDAVQELVAETRDLGGSGIEHGGADFVDALGGL